VSLRTTHDSADSSRRQSYSADWGDYISFAERFQEKAENEGVDVLIVDTGDRIEGNGLYDASDPKGRYTTNIFKEQHIDIICSGNHELYKQNSSENEYLVTEPNFKGNYLASNLDIFDPQSGERVPLAPRFKKFTTKNQGIRVLAFGFIFDFTANSNNTVVQPVEKTIQEQWFQDAIRDREVDLFLVAGHVSLRSPEYDALYKAIRSQQWDTPIQFFGGHTHIRDYVKYDSKAYALESGRYMETVGFMSITGLSTGGKPTARSLNLPTTHDALPMLASPTYARRYIDNNLFSFYHHTSLNSSTFPTPHGRNVSASISLARKALNLDTRFGCAPTDLWTNRAPYPSENSIFTWLQELVLPNMIHDPTRNDTPRLVLTNTGSIRFDIFKGPFTIDTTFTVSPFTSGFRFVKDVPLETASKLLIILNQEVPQLSHSLHPLGAKLPVRSDQSAPSQPYSPQHAPSHKQIPLTSPLNDTVPLTPGYTTHDDAGTDGDDTIHSPINFYAVPNCIESRIGFPKEDAEPETVDLVYNEFIQPYILLALKFLGTGFEEEDTGVYMEGMDMTGMIERWVQANWGC